MLEGACTKRAVRSDIIESIVLQAIKVQISLIDNLGQIIDQINKSPRVNNQSSRLNAMLKHHEAEHAKLTKISDALYADWKNGDITREEYLRMKADFTARIDEVAKAIQKIRDDCDVIAGGVTSDNPYFLEFKKYRNVNSLKRDMLVDLVDSISVHKNGEIEILFNFADQHQRITDFIENNERELVVLGKTQSA